jgi:hypothetical protein
LYLFTNNSIKKSRVKGFETFASIYENKQAVEIIRKKRISKPYQFLGVWIAQNLDDFENVSMYIRLAKYQDRSLLENAVSYVADYPNPGSKRKLFMWYLKGKLRKIPKPPKKKIQSSQDSLF